MQTQIGCCDALESAMSDGFERDKLNPLKTVFGLAVAAATYHLINWHGWLWAAILVGGALAVGAVVDHQVKARKGSLDV